MVQSRECAEPDSQAVWERINDSSLILNPTAHNPVGFFYMTVESIYPFLLILLPIALAFFAEALVIYFFKIRGFWTSLALSIIINVITLLLLYVSSLLLGKLGYEFNGLLLPPQVMLFFWWLSVIVDGALLQVFSPKKEKRRVYVASIVMNTLSYLFLYFFITNSH